MKKNFILFITLMNVFCFAQSQDYYLELYGGFSTSHKKLGTLSGISGNYQINKSLFTLRYVSNNFVALNFYKPNETFLLLPYFKDKVKIKEWAALYGKKWDVDNFSYSFSGGISSNENNITLTDENLQKQYITENLIGFPFEANVKWVLFPTNKNLIQNTFGFKLLGNISKETYVGVALVYGIGIHKN